MTQTNAVHVSLKEPAEAEAVSQALEGAGIGVQAIREVTRIHDGYALTELLAQGIWEHETGQAHCASRNPGRCPGEDRHRGWAELSEEQRDAFIARYVRFLESCREEELMTDLLLKNEEAFQGVAVHASSHR